MQQYTDEFETQSNTQDQINANTIGSAYGTGRIQGHEHNQTDSIGVPVGNLIGYYKPIIRYTPTAAGTATVNLSKSNVNHIQMPAGNITIALSGTRPGQCFILRILQDSVGSRTVTWFTTIRWAGGTAPTLTTTANKADTFGFEITGTGTYDGFVVGQNL